MKKIYDVIIAGAGAAGLYAALQFDRDVSVLIIAKRELSLSNSSLAQGGVAAVLDKDNDNFKLHIADTLIAGKYKNNLSAIEVLVTEGPRDVLNLKKLGVAFDLDDSGKMQMTLEAGRRLYGVSAQQRRSICRERALLHNGYRRRGQGVCLYHKQRYRDRGRHNNGL